MKTSNKLLLLASFIFVGGLFSCTKKTEVKSNTELLTQKPWKFTTQGLDENNNGIIEDSEADLSSCQEDDQFSFNVNHSGSFAIGTTACSPDDQNITFTWSFSNNETELTIFAFPEKIRKLDETTLEVYLEQENSVGQTVKYIRKFEH
jgi:hypothetical protein